VHCSRVAVDDSSAASLLSSPAAASAGAAAARDLLSLSQLLHTMESQQQSLGSRIPHLPTSSMQHVLNAMVLGRHKPADVGAIMQRVYPLAVMPETSGANQARSVPCVLSLRASWQSTVL
jgi:hypothetical protein